MSQVKPYSRTSNDNKNAVSKISPLNHKQAYKNCQKSVIQPRDIYNDRTYKKARSSNKILVLQNNNTANFCNKKKNSQAIVKHQHDSRNIKNSVNVRNQSKRFKKMSFNRDSEVISKLQMEPFRLSQQLPKRHTKSVMVFGCDRIDSKNFKKSNQRTNNCSNKDSMVVTRRKGSMKSTNAQRSKKVRTKLDSQIQLKIQDFRVIANCLRQFTREQLIKGDEPDPENILKLIQAFNRSEIGIVSKPLESLISEILVSIRQNILFQQAPIIQKSTLNLYSRKDQKQKGKHRNRTKTSCNDTQFQDSTVKKPAYPQISYEKMRKKVHNSDQKGLGQDKNRTCSGTRLEQQFQTYNDLQCSQKQIKQEGQLQQNLKKRSVDLQNLIGQQVRLKNFKQQLVQNPMTKQQKSQQIKRLSQLLEFQKQAMMSIPDHSWSAFQKHQAKRAMTYNSDSDGQQFLNYQIRD